VEEVVEKSSLPAGSSLQKESCFRESELHQRISEIDATESPRMDTTNAEFNRVLGGLVPGSVTLLVASQEW
jgi:DNA repair protein RadA/Sms